VELPDIKPCQSESQKKHLLLSSKATHCHRGFIFFQRVGVFKNLKFLLGCSLASRTITSTPKRPLSCQWKLMSIDNATIDDSFHARIKWANKIKVNDIVNDSEQSVNVKFKVKERLFFKLDWPVNRSTHSRDSPYTISKGLHVACNSWQ
jgi:hypothetical protein